MEEEESLRLGLSYARKYNRFATIENQSKIKTLVGLVIGQKIAFKVARTMRQQFYVEFDQCLQKYQQKIILSISPTFPKICQIILLQYLDKDDFAEADALVNYYPWREVSKKDKVIRNILIAWTVGGEELALNSRGIGPWTTKAFRLMCSDDNDILLTEDKYIQKMVSLFNRAFKNHKSLSTLSHSISKSNLSKLFWRITPIGVAKIAAKQKYSHDCFI